MMVWLLAINAQKTGPQHMWQPDLGQLFWIEILFNPKVFESKTITYLTQACWQHIIGTESKNSEGQRTTTM